MSKQNAFANYQVPPIELKYVVLNFNGLGEDDIQQGLDFLGMIGFRVVDESADSTCREVFLAAKTVPLLLCLRFYPFPSLGDGFVGFQVAGGDLDRLVRYLRFWIRERGATCSSYSHGDGEYVLVAPELDLWVEFSDCLPEFKPRIIAQYAIVRGCSVLLACPDVPPAVDFFEQALQVADATRDLIRLGLSSERGVRNPRLLLQVAQPDDYTQLCPPYLCDCLVFTKS